MKNLARSRLVKSTVVDNESGKTLDSRVRTSSGTFLLRGEDEVVKRIEKRISLVTMIPEGGRWGVGAAAAVRGARGAAVRVQHSAAGLVTVCRSSRSRPWPHPSSTH